MTPSERERRAGGWPDGQAIPAPNVDRVRRQVMSNQEADEAARYIEAMQERVRELCDYVREAAGDESCIVPIASLNAIRERAERAEAAARDFAAELRRLVPHDPLRKNPDQAGAAEVLAPPPVLLGRGRDRGMSESIVAALHRVPGGPRLVYRCSECGAHDHWGPGWLWYGDWIRGPSRIFCPKCAEPHRHEVIEP